MSTHETDERGRLLQGTLDLLVLRTLELGPQHGQGIARAIQERSSDALLVEHGSLYPALKRLEERGWVRARWGVSDSNRRARFYELTAKGKRQLVEEAGRWQRLVDAVGRILGPDPAEG
ncbi:MAG: PadR family transcriptional regulator [Longimicrobiales bacterium]